MKKIALAFMALTLISSSACADNGEVVATYANGKVTSEEIMKHYEPVLSKQKELKGKKFADLDKNLKENLVKNYINEKLILKAANDAKIQDSVTYKEKIKNAEKVIMQQVLFESKTKDINDKAITKEYNNISANLKGQKEIKVSHILLADEAQANEVKAKLNKGTSFEKLAKEYSKDDATKIKGGEIGYIVKGRLVPEFDNVAFTMKKNQVSKPVKTTFGWHVIKVSDIRDLKIPPKDQIANEIKNKLTGDAIREYISGLEKDAKIEMKFK